MSSNREPLPTGSLILGASVCIPVGAFLLGFLGHVGSLHHAAHLFILALGLELLLAAFGFISVAIDRTMK